MQYKKFKKSQKILQSSFCITMHALPERQINDEFNLGLQPTPKSIAIKEIMHIAIRTAHLTA